jgi:hypothetical protein
VKSIESGRGAEHAHGRALDLSQADADVDVGMALEVAQHNDLLQFGKAAPKVGSVREDGRDVLVLQPQDQTRTAIHRDGVAPERTNERSDVVRLQLEGWHPAAEFDYEPVIAPVGSDPNVGDDRPVQLRASR